VSDLEERKRMLVAESEVYRQMLKLEIHNFRIYGVRMKRRLTSAGMVSKVSLGLASWLTGKRRLGWWQIGALAFMGWRWYRRRSSTDREPRSGKLGTIFSVAEEFLRRGL
jgi:hypothetical protein